ncbi:hypothetical protein CJ178_32270 [Rhodococcus sp. ACPA4]|uniref:type II toxin-antitoxin system RelE/ParE family toxin n=1 Tax=Rhodococcus sp. ACPA4 TaxID=2028571 RepID=UPI000BB0DBF5|nr:hypothetical protein CJ178_32270 [Rhodococcus sp. ACPA4]
MCGVHLAGCIVVGVSWKVRAVDEVQEWAEGLDEQLYDAFRAAVELLQEEGPTLGRPLVDRIHTSRFHNMKELRIKEGGKHIRVLFVFDPRSRAVLLVAGDKTGNWDKWYRVNVKIADARYRAYLDREDPT